jgi:hypothetical protein
MCKDLGLIPTNTCVHMHTHPAPCLAMLSLALSWYPASMKASHHWFLKHLITVFQTQALDLMDQNYEPT